MPLTALQKDILTVLARHRSQESHFAGGIVINAADDSPRFSRDFDIFHDIEPEVSRSSDLDVASLRQAGFAVATLAPYGEWSRPSAFRKARVARGSETVEIDWAADSAFRFFPIEPDPQLGWRLHRFDVATNKALALSARTETRDYVDIVHLHKEYPLVAICWAACGKDPGFSPLSLLKMMKRFAKIDPTQLEEIQARALDAVALKAAWIQMSNQAESQIVRVADQRPDLPIGVAFVDEAGHPGWIGDNPKLRIHPPSLRGCWPSVRVVKGPA